MVAGSIHLPYLHLSCLTALHGLYGQGTIYLTADPAQTAYTWPSLAGLGKEFPSKQQLWLESTANALTSPQ